MHTKSTSEKTSSKLYISLTDAQSTEVPRVVPASAAVSAALHHASHHYTLCRDP